MLEQESLDYLRHQVAPSDGLDHALQSDEQLQAINEKLAAMTATERIAFALECLPGNHVLSSSFGAQAAVSLHLATNIAPNLPVILIDTGYLFSETYQFIEQLREQLRLNLKVYQSPQSPAWMEAMHGKLWEKGLLGIEQYNQLRKVEPMQRALDELGAQTWIAGLRRGQASTRAQIDFLALQNQRWKFHPIADWTDRDIWAYLQRHQLDYHPLWHQNYVSIGDVHTSAVLAVDAASAEDTRFFGLKRECGLHEHWSGKR